MANEQKPKKKKLFDGLFAKLKATKYTQYVIAGVLGLIVLVIFLSSCSTKTTKKKTTQETQNSTQNSSAILTYSEMVEHKLENVLASVKGCSNVKVMVVAATSPIITLAEQTEEKTTGSGENKVVTKYPVYIENGSNKTPMVLYESAPQITGILVIAKGAGDANIKLKIISAISILLGVESSKIEVLEGK